jgi:excisionase family DNA binding protein
MHGRTGSTVWLLPRPVNRLAEAVCTCTCPVLRPHSPGKGWPGHSNCTRLPTPHLAKVTALGLGMAQQLHLTTETVRDYPQVGKLKGFKVGKQWRIREQGLEAFIEALLQKGNG